MSTLDVDPNRHPHLHSYDIYTAKSDQGPDEALEQLAQKLANENPKFDDTKKVLALFGVRIFATAYGENAMWVAYGTGVEYDRTM